MKLIVLGLLVWWAEGAPKTQHPDQVWNSVFGREFEDYYIKGLVGPKGQGLSVQRVSDANDGLPWFPFDGASCTDLPDDEKLDCLPRGDINSESCTLRGCCWKISSNQAVPACYYPPGYNLYNVANCATDNADKSWTLHLNQTYRSSYPTSQTAVTLKAVYLDTGIVQITVTDNEAQSVFPNAVRNANPARSDQESPLQVKGCDLIHITRQGSDTPLLSIPTSSFSYTDQLIQLTAQLSTKFVYGLGERRGPFLNDFNWNVVTLFAHDAVPSNKVNGYGAHPMFLAVEDNGTSFGVFLNNFYPMDIVLTPSPSVTYRVLGGPLELYILPGPTPEDVVRQYGSLIGTTFLPPYWSLGFHLSRYGYNYLCNLVEAWDRTLKAGVPVDTQWADIDYMVNHNDFTVDSSNWQGFDDFINKLHEIGMHFVPILDAGVSGSEEPGSYPPYDQGLAQGIFMMNPDNTAPLLGHVWNPNVTVYPDYYNPKTASYWQDMFEYLYKQIKYDGIWIDMNEPSNFADGSLNGCPDNSLEHPPYTPGVDGGHLSYKTACMSAVQYPGRHYQLHNTNGYRQTILSANALYNIRDGKRPFVLSRSTAAGNGFYGAHWTGDVVSSWDDLKQSVSDMMSFNTFQIPMVGTDICGFLDDTTPELCARWHQLGAFYPFSRNHNTINTKDQDPASLGPLVLESAKKALTIRYTLLPYLYTLFWDSHQTGSPVIKPTFNLYPEDKNTYTLEHQYFWGTGLLVVPVLEEGGTSVDCYLGKGLWYDWYSQAQFNSSGGTITLDAPQDTIPLLIRGGTILPLQDPGVNTQASRQNEFSLLVALDENNSATGKLVWDDGETFDALGPNQVYNQIQFTATQNTVSSQVLRWAYPAMEANQLRNVTIFPAEMPANVQVTQGQNTRSAQFEYKDQNKVLTVRDLKINLKDEFVISFE